MLEFSHPPRFGNLIQETVSKGLKNNSAKGLSQNTRDWSTYVLMSAYSF